MNDLQELVQTVIAKVCNVPRDRVRPDVQLEELGVDSLTASEILVELEIRLDKELPVSLLRRLDTVHTVGDIMAQIDEALGSAAR